MVAQCIAYSLPVSATIIHSYRTTISITVIDAIVISHELTYDIQSDHITDYYPHTVSVGVAVGTSDDVSIDGDVSRQYNVRSGGGDRGE